MFNSKACGAGAIMGRRSNRKLYGDHRDLRELQIIDHESTFFKFTNYDLLLDIRNTSPLSVCQTKAAIALARIFRAPPRITRISRRAN